MGDTSSSHNSLQSHGLGFRVCPKGTLRDLYRIYRRLGFRVLGVFRVEGLRV